ncbi:PTS sugar transporter subunit IIA [Enterococcus casseliflavus]|nr:PTS sugar transporter subunit IIA [Enterococcus casseliflavus]
MYIPQERILLDQHFTDATEALTKIGEYLVNQEIVSLPYVKSLLRRHQKTGVYIGNFVALPHGEEEAQQWIKEEGLFLIQVPDGVDFGTKEQPKIATILFRSRPKRAAISCFARNRLFCSDMQNVRALSDAESVEEIQQILLAEE